MAHNVLVICINLAIICVSIVIFTIRLYEINDLNYLSYMTIYQISDLLKYALTPSGTPSGVKSEGLLLLVISYISNNYQIIDFKFAFINQNCL